MPHAVSMPSLEANESGVILASSRPSLDMHNFARHSYEKNNRNTRPPSFTSVKNNKDEINGHAGGLTNKDLFQIGGSNAATNEQLLSINFESISCNSSTFSSNVTSTSIENGRGRSPDGLSQFSDLDKNPILSSNSHIQMNNIKNISSINGNDQPSRHSQTKSTLKSNGVYYSSPISTHQSATSQSVLSSNYRFSFPASNPKTTLVFSSTSTNSLQNPCTSELNHRHTLQIPRSIPARPSKDDAPYTSGRFSPTTSNSLAKSSLNATTKNTQISNHEEVCPNDDALLWAEAVRQKRASKRRKKDDEDEDRVVVGNKVDQNHENWVMAYNMLTGIRFTVSRTNAKIDRPLTNADFEARHKFSFDITGNELTPSAKYDFKFKDYAPWVFRYLRSKFKLDPADYLMSLTSKYILSELGSPGKSGSFFYFSRDYKYIIKTIHHAEHKFLRKILKEYFAHVEENPNTLLSQFYGLHRVKMPYGRKIHFVVMNNLFPPHRDIHQTFDLKGSTVGRDYKEEDLTKNPRATLKDLNWLRRNLHLEFGPEKKNLFFEQMEKDVHLLQRLGIMDYSMLVGIHNLQIGNQENLRDKTLQVFQPGGDGQVEDIERGIDPRASLLRTPSKLESARKARELRQIIKQEKPIPMGQSSSRMPDTLEGNTAKKELLFYGDDGGFQATHEDNSPGDQIFFLSIIDCLTHYGTVKKLEHFWKGLKHDKRLISPVAPDPYGERFVEFIEGRTKSPEEIKREALRASTIASLNTNRNVNDFSPGHSLEQAAGQQTQQSSLIKTPSRPVESDSLGDISRVQNKSEMSEPRPMKIIRSASADFSGSSCRQTLPVVEEIGEIIGPGGSSSHKNGKKSYESSRKNITSTVSNTISSNGEIMLCNVKELNKEMPSIPK